MTTNELPELPELKSPYPAGKRAAWAGTTWTPSFTSESEDEGEVRSVPHVVTDTQPDDAEMLTEVGLSPATWEIVSRRESRWQRHDQVWLSAYRLTVKRRGAGSSDLTVEQMDKILRSYRSRPRAVKATGGTLLIGVADLQAGKLDGTGSAGLVERFARITEDIRQHISRRPKKLDRLIIAWAGDCLTADAEIVTRRGIVRISDVAGQNVEIKDGNGGWVDVPIKSYGQKPITRVTWKSRKASKVTTTSSGHEWILRDGQRVRTEDLTPGMSVLKSARKKSLPELSQAGIQAGFIFGDGTETGNGARAILCGDKDKALLPWFPGVAISTPDGKGQRRTAARFPSSWRRLPDIEEGTSFLFGWLSGYFAADGCADDHGGARLSSAVRTNLEFVRSVCAVLGIDTYPIREVTEHASGRYNDGPLYEIAFGVRSLPGEFFLIPTHRARIENAHGKTKQTVSWVVDSVESTGRMEETFCCEVPTTQSFLLADGILTSNCIEGVVAQNGRLVARLDLSVTEQVRLYRRLALHQIATLSPLANEVLVVCVAGNHDESYRQVDMGVNDSWAIEGMSAVSDALVLGGDKYSHVKFLFPEHERLDVTFNAGSLESPFVIGLTHGHLASSPNGEINWWKGQAHAEQPIGQAQLLLTGHFHHLRIEQTGCRKSWIQLPAMDGGSAWFLRKKGEDSAAGMITLDIGDGRWSNLRVWE